VGKLLHCDNSASDDFERELIEESPEETIRSEIAAPRPTGQGRGCHNEGGGVCICFEVSTEEDEVTPVATPLQTYQSQGKKKGK